MTEEIYNESVETTAFDAVVVSCEKSGREGLFTVELDRTAFFPEQGGQYADRGTLTGEDGRAAKVADVQIRDGIILHLTAKPFRTGEKVHGAVEWADRYDKMQQHTAEHIVSGIVCSALGCSNVGFALGPDHTHMDYDAPMTREQVREAERRANEAVWKNLPVQISWPDAEELSRLSYRSKKELEGAVRIVTIPGVDVCACCAPHVKRTGEIGLIRIVSAEKYKGGVRMVMLAGQRALAYDTGMLDALNETARSLSVKPEQVPGSVEKLRAEDAKLRYDLRGLRQKLLEIRIAETAGEENPVLFEPGLDRNQMQHAVDGMMQGRSGFCGIFSGSDEEGYLFVIGSVGHDCRPVAAALRRELGGKGGGRDSMIQGSVNVPESAIRTWFSKLAESDAEA